MCEAILYIHGKGGSAEEASRYARLCAGRKVVGLDYHDEAPWIAVPEIREAFDVLAREQGSVCLLANSIGAYFAMSALGDRLVSRAFFISPVVDLEKLIVGMLSRAGIAEAELEKQGDIRTDSGEVLSWQYLSYVREHPISWDVETHVLYGEHDSLIPFGAVEAFAKEHEATLTVMPNAEHWFHTAEQMAFLDDWLTGHLE